MVEPAKPVVPAVSAPPTPDRLFAERFKTVDELEGGYKNLWTQFQGSSAEAKRLKDVGDQAQAQSVKYRDELEALKIEQQLGPEIKDLTPDEEATMTPAQLAKHSAAKLQRNWLKDKLETQAKQKAEDAKIKVERLKSTHVANLNSMAKNAAEFPRLEELAPVIHQVMDWAPELGQNPDMPKIAYLVAYGHEAMQRDRAAKAESDKSAEAARLKAAQSLPAVSGGGGGGNPEPPAPAPANAAPEPGSDAEHNARLVAAHRGSTSILPIN